MSDVTEQAVAKIEFFIPDSGKMQTPFSDMHYYKWMKEKGLKDVHGIKTKMEYLKELGFDKTIHILGNFDQDLTILRGTEETFFRIEVRPEMEAKQKAEAEDYKKKMSRWSV